MENFLPASGVARPPTSSSITSAALVRLGGGEDDDEDEDEDDIVLVANVLRKRDKTPWRPAILVQLRLAIGYIRVYKKKDFPTAALASF